MIAPIAPMAEYMPMRVNIRFIAKKRSEPKGDVVPPCTPVQTYFRRSPIAEENMKLARIIASTSETNSDELTPCLPEKYFEANGCTHEHHKYKKRQEDISLTPLDNPCQISSSLLSEKSRRQRRRQPTTSRQTTVISPFSERRNPKDQDIRTICQPMPLQTTGGFFKGKPRITPLTRLGCFRMRTQRMNLMATNKENDKRCYTADIPRLTKPTVAVCRPVTHIPQRCEDQITEKHLPIHSTVKPFSNGAIEVCKENSSEKFTNHLPYVSLRSKCTKRNKTFQIKHEHDEGVLPLFRVGSEETQLNTGSLISSSEGHRATRSVPEIKQFQVNPRGKINATQFSPFSRNLKINTYAV